MKLNKKMIIFLAILFVGASNSLCFATEAAQEQIDKTITTLRSVAIVAGEFQQQKKLQGMQFPLRSQGHFIFWKKHGLYLVNEKPFFNATTITGDSLINWQQDGSANVAQEQSGLVQHEINKTLLAFFSADVAAIESNFSPVWSFEKETWQLILTPKLDMIKKYMLSATMRGNKFLNQLDVVGANGDITHLEFFNIVEQKQITGDQCHWFYKDATKQCALNLLE